MLQGQAKKVCYRRNPRLRRPLASRIFSIIRQLKLASFGWRFIFASVFLFGLVFGMGLVPHIFKSILAENEGRATINFYANSAWLPEQALGGASGWQGETKALHQPELGPEAEADEFSDGNSAIYAGGDYALVLSGFNYISALTAANDELSEGDLEIGDEAVLNNELGIMNNESPRHDLGQAGIMNNEFGAIDDESAGASDAPAAADEESGIPSVLLGAGTVNESEEVQVEDGVEVVEGNEGNTDDVEIIGGEEMMAEPEVTIESEQAAAGTSESEPSPESAPLSFLDKVYGSSPVLAEEVLVEPVGDLDELGEFISARLNFSLAIRRKAAVAGLDAGEGFAPDVQMDENEEIGKLGNWEIGSENGIEAENKEGGVNQEEAVVDESEIMADESEIPSAPFETSADNELGAEVLESGAVSEDEAVEVLEEAEAEETAEVIEGGEAADKENNEVSLIERSVKPARAQGADAKLNIWYSLEEGEASPSSELWQRVAMIEEKETDNFSNGGYYSIALDEVASWEDLAKLQIKLAGLAGGNEDWQVFIDSAWIEVEYDQETELEKLKKRQRWEEALALLSDDIVFEAGEDGSMQFRYKKNEERIWETLGEWFGFGNFWQDVDLGVKLLDPKGEEAELGLTIIFEDDGTFTVKLPDGKSVQPGRYELRFFIIDRSGEEPEEFELKQEFFWGVLAMNFDKTVYEANETGFVQMAVLDDQGHTICDAKVELRIANFESGEETVVSTEDGTIEKSTECGPETVTNQPDYSVYYQFAEKGEYEFRLTATTKAGEKTSTENIFVKAPQAFAVSRSAPTRIWPKADYGVKIEIRANEDFAGEIVEKVPDGFKISGQELVVKNAIGDSEVYADDAQFSIEAGETEDRLVWRGLELRAGETAIFSYTFDAPDRSPELYLIGPLRLENTSPSRRGSGDIPPTLLAEGEMRQWQIASDSFAKRARTVMFQAGVFNETAAGAGQNTNTDYTLPAFNWRLAESGVAIKSAYVVMETQFEAYNDTGTTYNGYKLGFDACQGSACASAFGAGSGQVLDDNSNNFVYEDTMGNVARLMLDVTSEAQLSAYAGNGVLMESQFGYRLKNAVAAYSSIANVSAMFVVTYTYDIDSENLTNTVAYPLDSTNGTDFGSRQAVQAACTADSNCPTFEYNMQVPEWPGLATSTNRLSQWFKFFGGQYNSGTTDFRPYLDIQTVNQDSAAFHFEQVQGTNGNSLPMYFPDWTNSGYAENQVQQTEIYINTSNYMLGGEVYETYIASSAAPVKTRTAVFPLGVITNGNTTAVNSQIATVYFPENGQATGTVKIKSAWVRLVVHGHSTTNTTYNAVVSTKVGDNATSSSLTYQNRASTNVINPVLNIIHIIPLTDYAQLEEATAVSGKAVKVNLNYSNAAFNGASAELMITYTYSSEENGYLSSLRLFGGQASAAPATSTVLSTANSVFPEAANKTLLAAGLYGSFITSNSAAGMNTGAHLSELNLSAGTPSCASPAYRAVADSVNMQSEMIRDVASAMDSQDNRAYSACYASDNTGLATDGAKQNGQLVYTYGWTNSPPSSAFNAVSIRRDGSGIVDIEIEVDDVDDQDCRARLEFEAGSVCAFSGEPGDPILDEADASITADYADPWIENDNPYQIGTANGYIKTASGTNSVQFDWLASSTLGAVEGAYCLRLTANDQFLDQVLRATTTVYVDTKKPTAPGPLARLSATGTSLTLGLGATTTETNFLEYKIFYKIYDGTDPDEGDSVWASTSDINLFNQLYGGKSSTTVTGLIASTTYSFALWAYDQYGNIASTSRGDFTTNDAPSSYFNQLETRQRSDGSGIVDVSLEVDDLNNHDQLKARVDYVLGAACDFTSPLDPALDENQVNISADFGAPSIENDNVFQVGNPGAYILTSPGQNTIQFDWFGKENLPEGDATYCLRFLANDTFDDQLVPATTTVIIDNKKPTTTGALSAGALTINSIALVYATTTPGEDTNEPATNAYKIYYKPGQSGVTMGLSGETEVDSADLDAFNYNGATSTIVSGLLENTWYVFNIWTFDAFGNMATGTEVAIKTSASINNDSFVFLNPETLGPDSNIAVAGPGEWIFRLAVSNVNGWQAISSTTLYFENGNDDQSPFTDFAFKWEQTGSVFSEIGLDAGAAVSLLSSSTANCSLNTCVLDFILTLGKSFSSVSTDYRAEVMSSSDVGVLVSNAYENFYQVRFPYVEQQHYRFRNDDGGE